MTRDRVLALLKESGDSYCSGEKMSQALGLSRAAVWKAVEGLRQEGYDISSVPNRGYRLENSPDRLSAGELAGALSGCTVGGNLICLDSVDSTNNYLKKLADEGAPHGTVVLSGHQTGGRGRRGNSFLSPAGKGLYLSALLRPELPPMDVIDLTAWIAVAVCDAVEQVIGERPGIKWTNDIILRQKKLCGILTELSLEGESGALSYVVAGIGINVSQNAEDFGPEVAPVAISLEQALGRTIRRADLAAAVIRALDRLDRDFPAKKAEYLERYRADCLTTGHEVRLIQKGETRTAFAESIDDDFALVVRWSDGTRETVTAGDVSVRGLLGYV
ncbi:MAG: biotin--[acetyl-CoA-carboxylase] ligase [Oscillospiraceae bacterium]